MRAAGLVALVSLVAISALSACTQASRPPAEAPAEARAAASAAASGASATPAASGESDSVVAGPSLYELTAELETQSGAKVPFDVHRGHPVLLAMFYATCPSACPVLMEDIKRLEARLPEDVRANTRVLLVSLDPGTDEPAVLLKAAERHAVDQSRWTLARMPDESVRELAVILGVKYRGRPDGEIDHSSALFLLDRQGAIVEKVEGLGQPADAIERRLLHM